ncbi:MAG TPA: hypothetical protein VFF73_06805 [Planctomycetota bacterium]|nr:hypothetical protein [Planctomycetota bacterium]
MDRLNEVEILAATLEEPARALIRAALVAQRQGRLDAAARVAADQVAKRPALRWAALLLALEAAELRLAGSVAYATPRSRFSATEGFPLFEERWGAFGCTVYPDMHQVRLELLPSGPAARHAYVLKAQPATDEASQSAAVAEAVSLLVHELESYLGVGVRLEEELRAHEDECSGGEPA